MKITKEFIGIDETFSDGAIHYHIQYGDTVLMVKYDINMDNLSYGVVEKGELMDHDEYCSFDHILDQLILMTKHEGSGVIVSPDTDVYIGNLPIIMKKEE